MSSVLAPGQVAPGRSAPAVRDQGPVQARPCGT